MPGGARCGTPPAMEDITMPETGKAGTGLESGLRAATFSMKVKGTKQGDIKGEAPASWKGHENEIQLFGWSHEVISPRDPASGLPTGRRMHHPVMVWGKMSKAAPLLFTALVNNENLTEVLINCFTQKQGSSLTIFFTIKLTNANIAAMQQYSSELDGTNLYRLQFTYEKIEFTWKDGGITAMDDWESRA